MTAVISAEGVKRSKRETGEADSDSYEEYKSDEDNLQGGRGGAEEDTTKTEVDRGEIVSQHKAENVVDGITAKKDTGDKKKEKKKREKHSKHTHDEEGEVIGGQEKKERKKEKKSKEGKKERKSKERKGEEKTIKVQTEQPQEQNKEVQIEEIRQKEKPKTVDKPKEEAVEETKLTEALAAKPQELQNEDAHPSAAASVHLESATDTAATTATPAPQETTAYAVTDSALVDNVAIHLVASTSEVSVPQSVKEEALTTAASTESSVPKEAEEKAAPSVAPTQVAPPSEAPVPGKASETAAPHVELSEAASSEAAKPTLSETAPPPAQESSREPVKKQPAAEATPITVAKLHAPEPSQPSSDTKSSELPPPQSDASDQAKASVKVEKPQAGPQLPKGVEQILERARKEADEGAAGSSRLLMARSLVARQEKLREQLTNIRHEFGDIDSEIRALKIDCYRNQRAFAKHH